MMSNKAEHFYRMGKMILGAGLIAGLVAPTPGSARSISANIFNQAGDPGNNQVQAGETAGLVPVTGAAWNAVGFANGNLAGTSAQTDRALNDETGAQAARFQSTLTSAYVGYSGAGSIGAQDGNRDIMTSYLSFDDPTDGVAPDDTGSLRISELGSEFTDPGYRVYVYFDTDRTDRTHTFTLTPDGGGARVVVGEDSGTYSGTFAEAAGPGTYANVAVFTGLTTGAFTLGVDSSNGRGAVSALQIISADHPLPPEILSLSASHGYASPGTPVTLSWQIDGDSTLLLGPDIGNVAPLTTNGVGHLDVSPTHTTTYTLTATNGGGQDTASVRVGVGPPRPNILFFLVDDMGWQDTSLPFHHDASGAPVVSALNQRYRTPSMERLSGLSMKFTQAYVSAVCTPTRVSLMTGMNATRHHVTTWTHPDVPQDTGSNQVTHLDDPPAWRKAGMDPTDMPLPAMLQTLGYRTIHAGKAHFGPNGTFAGNPADIGFDVNIAGHGAGGPGSYWGTANFGTGMWHVPGLESYHGQSIFLTEALTLEMKTAISESVAQDTPFFAYMAHYAVHAPFTEDTRFSANYPGLSGSGKAYATMVEGMDKSLGDLLDHLETLGVAENTLVIFLSDNGGDAPISNGNAPLRGKKGTRYEGGLRVPLMVGWLAPNPGNAFQQALPITGGSRCDDIVAGYDLFPTLQEVAGGTPTGDIMDGHSLTPYLREQPGVHRPQEYVAHFPHGHNNDHYAVIRQGDWKLIHQYGPGSYELYNLASDLGETTDLAASEPARTLALARRLARELDRMDAQYAVNLNTGLPQPPVMPDLPGVDHDGDGLPDLEEDANRNGLLDDGETDPDLVDTDGDGFPDPAERIAGTDPRNPSSLLRLVIESMDADGITLGWPGKSGQSYQVETLTPDLPHTWTEAGTVPGEDGGMSHRLTRTVDTRLYRVVIP